MTFAAQPAVHNPITASMVAQDRFAFFGAWRGDKYPDRAKELAMLLDAAATSGQLVIYDRNANQANKALHFPTKWAEYVHGSLAYQEVNNEYRNCAAVLNVNSAVTSPTMVARRVFEVLACRTPVISTPAASLEPLFGDTVLIASDASSAREHVDQIQNDLDYRERIAHRGYRHVHSAHTYRHRIDDLFEIIGLAAPPEPDDAVDVVCVSNRPEQFEHLMQSFERQVHPRKRLIFVANSSGYTMENVGGRVEASGGLALQVDPDATLGDCLNHALEHSTSPVWAKLDDDDFYGAHHVSDLLLAHRFANAAVVGRRTYFLRFESDPSKVFVRNPGHEFSYVDLVSGGSFLVDRERTDRFPFESVRAGTDTRFMRALRGAGESIFSASRYNYLVMRRSDPSSHTWQMTRDDILKEAQPVATNDPERFIAI